MRRAGAAGVPGAPRPESEAEARRAKSPSAFRTISEVAEELDVPAHVLRFWETKFAQLSPMKRGGGRRYYRPADVALVKGVRALLYDEGLTIKGVQKLLREKGVRHVAAVGEGAEAVAAEPDPVARPGEPAGPAPDLHAVIARLETVRDRLRSA